VSKWMLRQTTAAINDLAQEAKLDPVITHVLAVRGYRSAEDIHAFMEAENMPLADPYLFKDMDKAVALISDSIRQKKQIVILGDYDADGITSTVILYHTLASLGANVSFYIPSRDTEGYGMNNEALDSLHEKGAEVILACDNGISAFEQVEFATSLGMETVILDHHDVNLVDGIEVLPRAAAIVDPHQSDCPYPFKFYCAAAICYRFSEAIYKALGKDWQNLGEELLPFATIGTICDLVDLAGENRTLVKKGLPAISASENLGLKALISASGIAGRSLDTYHVGFILGPCINASGRLEIADIAVELFLAEEEDKAAALAQHLIELNDSRKQITVDGTLMAIEQIQAKNIYEDRVIVLCTPHIPESIAGIVAGKIKEYFYHPAIVISGDSTKKKDLRGSCRSIEGYNIFEALSSCSDLLKVFGGHPMAAGFSILPENVPLLQKRLNEECLLTVEEMEPLIQIDKVLPMDRATYTLAKQIEALGPFGKGNHKPNFAEKNVMICRIGFLGREEQVLKLYCLSGAKSGLIEVISFNGKDSLQNMISEKYTNEAWLNLIKGKSANIYMDFVYTININKYRDREYPQIHIIDFRISN